MVPIHFFLLLMILLGLVSGCGREPEVEIIRADSQIEQARVDILAMDQVSSEGGRSVDELGGHLYTQIFGGTDTSSVRNFFHERVRHLIDFYRSDYEVQGDFDNHGWLKAAPTPTPDPNEPPPPETLPQVAGYNIGVIFWLKGLVNQSRVTIIDQDGQRIPLKSSRTGVIAVGPAYGRFKTQQSRQSVLIHEARHSDCTGGVSDIQLDILRNAKHEGEWVNQIPVLTCGHLHVECKTGDLAGIPACDGELFGAYGVGAVFSLAQYYALQDRGADREDVEEMKIQFFTQIDRLEMVKDIDAYFQGQGSETPDMTSSDYPGMVVR